MNRYEQRKQKRLLNLEIAEGYREMATKFQLIQAINEIRVARHRSKEGEERIQVTTDSLFSRQALSQEQT